MSKIYDCNLCMHKEVCDLWAQKIANSDPKSKPDDGDDFLSCPSVSYGCRHFDSKRRYICISDVKGPSPDSPGPEGTEGPAPTRSPTCQPPDWLKFQMKRMILEEMEYMRRDLYRQEEQLKVLRVKLYKHLKEANQCGDANGRGND